MSAAGLVPALRLGESAGLHVLLAERLTVDSPNPVAKPTSVIAGMLAGADSIDDLDLLRHGGMGGLFGGVRAPSTLGTYLRGFTHGHVQQLDAVGSRVLAGLSEHVSGSPAPPRSTGWRSSMSTTRSVRSTATPDKAPRTATRGCVG